MYNPFSLNGKKILVTGASSGIGRATAVECALLGATVVVTGRDAGRLSETLNMMAGEGHLAVVADLTQSDDVVRLVQVAGTLDGLVHSAGCNRRMLCQYIKETEMSTVINTNLVGPMLLTKSLLRHKSLANGSSVVFVSSIAVHHSSIGDSVYSATKGGISSFARVLALELAPKSIRVNCIEPGMIRTNLIEHGPLSEDDYAADTKRYPLGRYGLPSEVAQTAVYLLSAATEWMTGSSIVIDGGISLV
jgi:NAD(P)-dependent dehydrogenase (short-subunit alcohol dehydrogenase family)